MGDCLSGLVGAASYATRLYNMGTQRREELASNVVQEAITMRSSEIPSA